MRKGKLIMLAIGRTIATESTSPDFLPGHGRQIIACVRRVVASDGAVPPVGNTVDVATATFTNDIGDTELTAVWTDPDFDASIATAYHVRALEIPTLCWSTYDSARNNLPLPTIVPPTIQERGWSSPIWYTPASGGQ